MAEGEGRYFSREEAEALLPEIESLLLRARALIERLDLATTAATEQAPRNGHISVNGSTQREADDLRRVQEELREVVGRLQADGIIVRDIRTGLIDFPTRREGVEVYLCWHLGEPPRIEWWHPTTTGIAGRQRL